MPKSKVKDYISWSQYSLFKQNPEEYKRIYIDGEERFVSRQMLLGSAIHEDIEKGTSEVEGIETIKLLIPKYQKHEYFVERTIEGVRMLGYIDLYSETKNKIKIGEIKTSVNPWTERMAKNHGQLKFYNLLVMNNKPIETSLFWLETTRSGELTGKVKRFEVEIPLADLLAFFADVKKVYQEIRKLWSQN